MSATLWLAATIADPALAAAAAGSERALPSDDAVGSGSVDEDATASPPASPASPAAPASPRPGDARPVITSSVRAEGPSTGDDLVFLADGRMLRGTLVEIEPGVAVAIVAASDGALRRFEWREVAVIERATRPAQVVAEGEAPTPAQPWVHLAVAGEGDVQLHELPAGATSAVASERRCGAPCDRTLAVDGGRRFVITGSGVPTSRPFSLDVGGDRLVARVRPGRSRMLTGGLLASAFGGGLAVTGVAFLAASRREECWQGPCTLPAGPLVAGVALLTGGVALLTGGVLMALRGRTRVRVDAVIRAREPAALSQVR